MINTITNSTINIRPTDKHNSTAKLESHKNINNFIFISLITYMMTLIFEGPLRYSLALAGLGTLIYLRDLLGVFVIACGIYLAIKVRRNIYDPLIVSIYALLTFLFLSLLINDVTIFSSFFGLKILAVFLLGMASAHAVKNRLKLFSIFLYFSVIASVCGIALNYLIGKLPWEGLTYDTSFGSVLATQEWWTNGERRLPGFTRASYDAAMIMGLGSAFLLSRTTRTKALALGLIAIFGIYFSTTKGMLLALGLSIFWNIFIPRKLQISIGSILCGIIVLLMVFLPILSCTYEFKQQLINEAPSVLTSFAERIVSMWPKSCAILETPYSWFLGSGIGSIGVPQMYSNARNGYSAADNLFVYLYVIGGIPFAAALFFTVFKCLKSESISGLDQRAVRSLLLAMLAYGITTNMQEQPFFAILAGIMTFGAWEHVKSD